MAKKLKLVAVLILPAYFPNLLMVFFGNGKFMMAPFFIVSFLFLGVVFAIFYNVKLLRVIFIVMGILNCAFLFFDQLFGIFIKGHVQIPLIFYGGMMVCALILAWGIKSGSFYKRDEEAMEEINQE